MAIEPSHLDRTATVADALIDIPTRSASAIALTLTPTATAPTPAAVESAVKQLQSAIDAGPNPAFTLDYLSGLSVITVRSNLTGEVVFQLPDSRAVELARLIKDGASLGSLGLLHTQA